MEILQSIPEVFLFGSVILFYISALLLTFLLFFAESTEEGFIAFFATTVFVVITSVWGTLDPLQYFTWSYLGLYLGIGFVYSLIRTYFYGRKPIKPYKRYHTEEVPVTNKELSDHRKTEIQTRKGYLKGNVFRWWFLFPVSLISWILTDLVKDAFTWIYDKLENVYESILDFGLRMEEDKPIKRG